MLRAEFVSCLKHAWNWTDRLVYAVGCFVLASGTSVAAEPFYYSTWYSQPNPAFNCVRSSVMPIDRFDLRYPGPGPLNADSPLYYQPGYGYVPPAWPFRSPLRYYAEGYAFGALSYGTTAGTYLNPGGGIGGYSALSLRSRFGGNNTIQMLHPPYYLPGSPGNDREFLFRW